MSIAQRRIELMRIIQERKYISINDLAKHFDVSSMTIRRDLSLFEAQGAIILTHGSVSINTDFHIEPSFNEKIGKQKSIKEEIAAIAAKEVQDGDTIILDCGTTTLQMVKYLHDKKITIITNSYPIVQYLSGNSKIKLIMAPGIYSEISHGFFGDLTIHFFNQFHVDKVFMATHGYDQEIGASVPDLQDAQTKKALLKAAKKKYLLYTKDKNNKVYHHIFSIPKEFDKIICK